MKIIELSASRNYTVTIGNGVKCLDGGWDYGLEKGSRIFFLDENGKVDPEQGYWELYLESEWFTNTYTWVYHNHAYAADASHTTCNHHNSVKTEYSSRGDAAYWN